MHKIQTAAELIAEIPAALHYYPKESVILLTYRSDALGNQVSEMVMRTELHLLHDPEVLDQANQMLRDTGSEVVFAVVVTEALDPDITALKRIHNLEMVWQTREICEGEAYQAIWSSLPPTYFLHAGDHDLLSGRIAPVNHAHSTHELLSRGEYIHPTRDEYAHALLKGD